MTTCDLVSTQSRMAGASFPRSLRTSRTGKSFTSSILGSPRNRLVLLLFFVQTAQGHCGQVCPIKAHMKLAAVGLAPKLLYYGTPHFKHDDSSNGNHRMAVTEYIEGRTLLDARDTVDKEYVKNRIREIVELLHSDNL